MRYNSWTHFKTNNNSLSDNEKLYTKANLSEMGLKPKKDAIGEYHDVKVNGTFWQEFQFYKLIEAEPKRKVSKSPIRELEFIESNLLEALYIINKSAKTSRDSKQNNYFRGYHGIVSRCKYRELDLYDLKDKAIKEMLNRNILSPVKIHYKSIIRTVNIYKNDYNDYDDDNDYNNYEKIEEQYTEYYLLLSDSSNNFTFHIPISEKTVKQYSHLPLEEITGIISAEKKRKLNLKFNESKYLLMRYISKIA